MYLPRSAALLGSRAIWKEKRIPGQEVMTPRPGRWCTFVRLQRLQILLVVIPLYLSQLELQGAAEIPFQIQKPFSENYLYVITWLVSGQTWTV